MNPSDFFFDISKLIKCKRWESGARTLNIGIPCSSTANEKSNTSNSSKGRDSLFISTV